MIQLFIVDLLVVKWVGSGDSEEDKIWQSIVVGVSVEWSISFQTAFSLKSKLLWRCTGLNVWSLQTTEDVLKERIIRKYIFYTNCKNLEIYRLKVAEIVGRIPQNEQVWEEVDVAFEDEKKAPPQLESILDS